MAKFAFYNITKANAEIDRLNVELAAANARIDELAKNEPEGLAALQGELNKLQEDNASLLSRLSAAEIEAAKVPGLEAKMAEVEASVDRKSSEKALSITQAQGQPQPIKITGAITPDDAVAAYMSETDPTRRAKIYRQHKDQIIAAAFRRNNK